MPIETLILVFIIIVLIAVLLFITLPKILYIKEDIQNTQNKLDDILKNRWNLVPKFIEAVKPYTTSDLKTLEEVILLRNTTFENMEFAKKIKADTELNNRLVKMSIKIREFADISEDEKFNTVTEVFDKLGKKLIDTKTEYNNYVEKLNKLTSRFPSNIVALIAGVRRLEKL